MSDTNLNPFPESKYLVRFPDCDPFNHLNNARYLDYIINAREDHTKQFYDFDIHKHAQETGNSWVVGQHKIEYIRPAMFNETITIKTCLIALSEYTLVVEGQVLDEEGQKLKTVLQTRYHYVSLRTGRRTAHAPELIEFFEQLVQKQTGELSF
ncbi:MAG: acyl-CoA thioesterase, partial [Hymenobacteraceae bacterium]|nr:acyl-CoA thioesterase [Hymenobacteraceae bacterium]MDX5396501.1 acyl-CoA thioesterase [Hymenobacteraceae bacterium]MDX5512565.1 acyl-CoA thioesterase [Hymenobacteraceae bacterium]